MANSIYTHEMQTTQTRDFDFVFVEEAALSNFCKPYKGVPPTATTTVSAFDRESLNRFHKEFKSLVMASNQAYLENEELAWEDTSLREPIDPYEIEWMDWAATAVPTIASPLVPTKVTLQQQAIKTLTGPPLGTPPPVEMWVVKAISVLVILNLLFAGLIVSGTRVNDWRNWLPL